MRRAASCRAWSSVPAMVLVLGACEREPDFDERYDAARQSIESKAQDLDAQLAPESTDGKADTDPGNPARTSAPATAEDGTPKG